MWFCSEVIWIFVFSSAEVLAAGTSRGRVALWHMMTVSDQKGDTKIHWKLQTPAEVEGNISQLQVSSGFRYLGIFTSCVTCYWLLQTIILILASVCWSLSPRVCLQWGSSSHLLAVCSSSCVVILSEHVMCSHYSQQMAAVQLTPTLLSLANFNTNTHITFHTDTHIRAVQVTKVRCI